MTPAAIFARPPSSLPICLCVYWKCNWSNFKWILNASFSVACFSFWALNCAQALAIYCLAASFLFMARSVLLNNAMGLSAGYFGKIFRMPDGSNRRERENPNYSLVFTSRSVSHLEDFQLSVTSNTVCLVWSCVFYRDKKLKVLNNGLPLVKCEKTTKDTVLCALFLLTR